MNATAFLYKKFQPKLMVTQGKLPHIPTINPSISTVKFDMPK